MLPTSSSSTELDVLSGEVVPATVVTAEHSLGLTVSVERNLYALAERMAARAVQPSTRRQYRAIYRSFADALQRDLGRPPTVDDLTADTVAAWIAYLQQEGGRGGRPAAPATVRQYATVIRAFASAVGADPDIATLRTPPHRPGPPETLSDAEYERLVALPDRRTKLGKRDLAILRVLGDAGLRNDEAGRLVGGSLRRGRRDSRRQTLFVLGKGNAERKVPLTSAAHQALTDWLAVHPLAVGRPRVLATDAPLFVALDPRAGSRPPARLTTQAIYNLVAKYTALAGVPEHLRHPHALRAFFATALSAQVPAQTVQALLGHADLKTTSRYLVHTEDAAAAAVELLDLQASARRRGRGRL